MAQFVRFLYGVRKAFFTSVLADRIKQTFDNKYAKFNREEIVYFTLGDKNTALLTKFGAKHIVQVSKDHSFETGKSYHSYNKMILLMEAAKLFKDVLYMDFDVYYKGNFDAPDIASTLEEESYGIGTKIQMPAVGYHKGKFFWRRDNGKQGREKISRRKGLMGCFIFLRQSGLVLESIFDDHEKLKKQFPRALLGDEQTITYIIEQKFGPLPLSRMQKELEPSVISLKRSSLSGLGFPPKNSMLTHR